MIQRGDVILFTRLTLRQAWRAEGLRGLMGWLGHWITALCSWTTEGGYDGFWEYVHVGIAVQDQHGGLRLMEFTSKGNGMALEPLETRCSAYPGAVVVHPLNERYRPLWNSARAWDWLRLHRHDRYRWGGLPFAILRATLGWEKPGAMFCSEAVVHLLMHLGIMPTRLPVWRGSHVTDAPVQAQGYAPCEVARLPQLARAGMRPFDKS